MGKRTSPISRPQSPHYSQSELIKLQRELLEGHTLHMVTLESLNTESGRVSYSEIEYGILDAGNPQTACWLQTSHKPQAKAFLSIQGRYASERLKLLTAEKPLNSQLHNTHGCCKLCINPDHFEWLQDGPSESAALRTFRAQWTQANKQFMSEY